MLPNGARMRPAMPVSSSTSRTAASSLVSSPSGCPLGRHHSRRPPRLYRAMMATGRSGAEVSTMTPPEEISSTVGREWWPGCADAMEAFSGVRFGARGTGWAMETTLSIFGVPVRDLFLGRSSPDLDFTTDADPDQTLAAVSGWADATWEVGRAFGTIALR